MLRAGLLAHQGKPRQAIQTYAQILSRCAGREELVRMARRKTVRLLLDSEPVDCKAVAEHLDALARGGVDEGDPMLWNCRFELSLARALAAGADGREEVWRDRVTRLGKGDRPLRARTLRRLDDLVRTGGAEEFRFAERVLTDALALGLDAAGTSEVRSRLNARRVRGAHGTNETQREGEEDVARRLGKMILGAKGRETAGQLAEATALYERIIREHPEREEAVAFAHLGLVRILLKRHPVDFGSVDSHLAALVSGGAGDAETCGT